jgi:hypothetical protein
MLLRSNAFLQDLSLIFGTDKSTIYLDFIHILNIIIARYYREIRWPESAERATLEGSLGIDGAILCVDGTNIPIERPKYNQEDFYRGDKGFHSMLMQVVCDHQGIIRHIEAGIPGQQNDRGAFNDSFLMRHRNILFDGNQILLADGGYKGDGPIAIPFNRKEVERGTQQLIDYNHVQRSNRVIVEHAIGRVKTLWTIVGGRWKYDRELLSPTWIACCLLTNRLERIRRAARQQN